jgi:hypothetical protein
MRIKSATVLLFMLLSYAAFLSPVQTLGQDSNTKPQTITLVARTKTDNYDNYTKAAFSFRYGINGDDAVKITRNDWDLLYGNISLNGDKDWFTVTLVTDDRSRIRELGELDWSYDIKIPILPACPEEDKSCAAVTFPSASSGKMLTDVNENVAKAIVGHMYLVHTKDRASDFYTLFRVEELKPSESCTISWKIVPSPEE